MELHNERTQHSAQWAAELHASRNHLYGDEPYARHLRDVRNVALRHIDVVPENERGAVIMACDAHDTIEDCAVTYNDVVAEIGERAADIVYAVSNELGKTRKERAERTYPKIRADSLAVFVKLCDRIANTSHARENGTRLFSIYRSEWPYFREQLHREGEWPSLWAELETVSA